MDFLSSNLPTWLLHVLGLAAHLGPCDIYAAGNTPCVAAHSTTRALYGNYRGPLYQIVRGSDNTTRDVTVLGGIAHSESQDAFCHLTTCEISIIYDQSGRNNHLTRAPPGSADRGELPGGYDILASAVAAPVTLRGRKVYGVFTPQGAGYRCDNTTGVAVGNEAEGIYAVLDGTHYNGDCCYDYGNAEIGANDEGPGTMETIYFGNAPRTTRGAGDGPWIMADIEDGLYGGGGGINDQNPSITHRFVTAIVKGADHNLWSIRGGNSQKGQLGTFYSGKRPDGYYPMKKRGAILLGVGGDNSFRAVGTFYEGAMTAGYPSDEVENKVQANIVAAGYGTTSSSTGPHLKVGSRVRFSYGDKYLAHKASDVALAAHSPEESSTWFVRTGNSDQTCYSFESAKSPGSYLRQARHQLHVDAPDSGRISTAPQHWFRTSNTTFAEDSTFCIEPAFDGSGGVAARSWNFPTRYWRPYDGHAFIASNGGVDEWDSSENFNSETSWRVEIEA